MSSKSELRTFFLLATVGFLSPFVSTTSTYAYTVPGNPSDYIVSPGTGYDGVTKLRLNGRLCSGSLLETGIHILTAAHCLPDNLNSGFFAAEFNLSAGNVFRPITNWYIPDAWTGNWSVDGWRGYDIAILELSELAPEGAERYELYRERDEIGKVGDKVGYGQSGTGNEGAYIPNGTKRSGRNRYDASGSIFNRLFVGLDVSDRLLTYDFDNGLAANDAFGRLFSSEYADLGLDLNEVMSAPGDSGGPTFINGKIAGVTSWGWGGWQPSDIDSTKNSSFGEFGGDTRVSFHIDWIDSILYGKEINDTEPAEVPESTPIVGLMLLGALGMVATHRRKQQCIA